MNESMKQSKKCFLKRYVVEELRKRIGGGSVAWVSNHGNDGSH